MPPVSHQNVRLGRGHHSSPRDEVCVMELASMLAGEPFTDHPVSVSPVLAAFLRGYNDGLDDARRQSLMPCASACVGPGPAGGDAEATRRGLISAQAGGPVSRASARFWLREGATIDESGTSRVGRRLGRAVARRGDDARHAEVLRLIDELVSAERRDAGPGQAPLAHRPGTSNVRALPGGGRASAPAGPGCPR